MSAAITQRPRRLSRQLFLSQNLESRFYACCAVSRLAAADKSGVAARPHNVLARLRNHAQVSRIKLENYVVAFARL